jgi:cell division protein FtsL
MSFEENKISIKAGAETAARQDPVAREMQMRRRRYRVRRKYVLMIIVSFVFAVALIYRYSLVIEINDRIMRENAKLSQLENENNLARKQIGLETDLEKIRILAESRLGMQKPDKDQIVYIKVPRRDHALVAVSAQQAEPDISNPFAFIFEQLRLIHKRLITN